MKAKEKLESIWTSRIMENKTLQPTDLYPYSKIKLTKKRNRKKFNKYFLRYISQYIWETYLGCVIATPLVGSFKRQIEFALEPIIPMTDTPKAEIAYLDYVYDKTKLTDEIGIK
jgi:hypothetical protein